MNKGLKSGFPGSPARAGLITLIFGGALVILTVSLLMRMENRNYHAELAAVAEQRTDVLKKRLSSTIEAVQSVSALYAASTEVTRSEFSRFAKIELREQPNIQALEWIPRVAAEDRGALETQAQRDGFAGFTITERNPQGNLVRAGERDEYFPVYFVEPLEGNRAALGFDLSASSARNKTLASARDSGRLTFSPRITLVQEEHESFGLLVFYPMYKGSEVPESIAKRRQELIGFSLGVLRVSDILAPSEDADDPGKTMDTYVFDVSAEPGQQILFPSDVLYHTRDALVRGNCIDTNLDYGDRTWSIVQCAPKGFNFVKVHLVSLTVLILGLMLTTLLAAYLRMLARKRMSVQHYVRQLQASEARYSDVVDNTQVMIQSVDAKTGKFVFVNAGWLSAMGYEASAAVNLGFEDIVHPEELEHCRKIFEQAISSGESQKVSTRFITKDGETRDMEGHTLCRRTEFGQMLSHGIFTDVTELNKVRNEHERVASELTTLIDTANAPIFGVDSDEKVNEWNQTAERITGYAKSEAVGRKLIEFIAEDYRVGVQAVLRKALEGEETASHEFRFETKIGDQIDVLLNSTIRRDAHGLIVGVVGFGQDITERKQAEAQVIQASKMATLGEMATGVAHELNQPLNVIRMAAGNSLRKIRNGQAEPEYLTQKLERIEAQIKRAANIIDHMRMFGRRASESPSLIDPREVVSGAFELMGEQLRLEEIEVEIDLPETCPSVLGHQIQTEQVILNLLTNARDAILAGRGGNEKRISMKVEERNDKAVRIVVEDTGGGIADNVIERIFEPFYTTKEMGKGTGLGLSISYGIIRDIGGTFTVSNTEEGARFEICLPVAAEQAMTEYTGKPK